MQVSDKDLIPINEELDMCRVHLEMFNAKQSKEFILETKNIGPETKIPPMVFHTLVENGLTHSVEEKGRFELEQIESKRETEFIFKTEPLKGQTFDGEGLGMAYIKSRLEQGFPGKWLLKSGPKENAWQTNIKIIK